MFTQNLPLCLHVRSKRRLRAPCIREWTRERERQREGSLKNNTYLQKAVNLFIAGKTQAGGSVLPKFPEVEDANYENTSLIYNSAKCNVVDPVCLLRAIRHHIITTGPFSAAAC